MINLENGVLTFEEPPVRIAPGLTRSEFLAAAWAQGATMQSGDYGPRGAWSLAGKCRSMSVTFDVFLAFEGERLTRLYLGNWDTNGTTSVEDTWLSKCLGKQHLWRNLRGESFQKTFAWGSVSSRHGDPRAGWPGSIDIKYSGVVTD